MATKKTPTIQPKWVEVHGVHRYNKFGCRCDICKEAKRAEDRKRRRKGKAPDGTHGEKGYAYGCRCKVCRAGQAARMRRQRGGPVAVTSPPTKPKVTVTKAAAPKPTERLLTQSEFLSAIKR